MTEPGKRFFLNCICYIHKFDGKRPLVPVQSSDRLDGRPPGADLENDQGPQVPHQYVRA